MPKADVRKSMEIYKVSMEGICKHFPGVLANDNVDFHLRAGEVHSLLGENGAGKTTLMKILAGLYKMDKGVIRIDDQKVDINTPYDAFKHGIGMVHQHFRLVDTLTVAENIHLGWEDTPVNINNKLLAGRVHRIAEELGYQVDPNAYIWQLSVGEQQRVEILRVLARGARILVMDEPTAVLTPAEAEELMLAIDRFKSLGNSVVFISHKLDEVMRISDRISVLRNGKNVETLRVEECDNKKLARLMIGQNLVFNKFNFEKLSYDNEIILELKNVQARNDRSLLALNRISFRMHKGEILGIAGVSGNGQSELTEVITGLREIDSGEIYIDGKLVNRQSTAKLVKQGVGFIPQDRIGSGMFKDLSVIHNAVLRSYFYPPIKHGVWFNKKEAHHATERLIEKGDVRVAKIDAPISKLSGGNQQKVVVQREINNSKKLLIATHPTRGLDVGAANEVYNQLISHRNNGNSVLVISDDLDELLLLSDRIAVIYEGEILDIFDRNNTDREKIGLLMGGIAEENEGGITQ